MVELCEKCGTPMLAITEVATETRPLWAAEPGERKVPGATRHECPKCDHPEPETMEAE